MSSASRLHGSNDLEVAEQVPGTARDEWRARRIVRVTNEQSDGKRGHFVNGDGRLCLSILPQTSSTGCISAPPISIQIAFTLYLSKTTGRQQ